MRTILPEVVSHVLCDSGSSAKLWHQQDLFVLTTTNIARLRSGYNQWLFLVLDVDIVPLYRKK